MGGGSRRLPPGCAIGSWAAGRPAVTWRSGSGTVKKVSKHGVIVDQDGKDIKLFWDEVTGLGGGTEGGAKAHPVPRDHRARARREARRHEQVGPPGVDDQRRRVGRLGPLDRTYDNLTIAGDWTDCGFNAGCVEAAVMSGRLAAHAISQLPRLEDIIGFDHP